MAHIDLLKLKRQIIRRFSAAGRLAIGIITGAFCFGFLTARADNLDDLIAARMRAGHITGLSLAIVQDGKIVRAQGYGFTDASGKSPVTPDTLFEAGSVSKSVAAFGALHLVQEGKLSLDTDVNTELRSWKVPENDFTKEQKVTLRRILSHTAGLTVHGFFGYATNAPIPSLVQVLDGVKPANSPPIRVDVIPGSKWKYSGGGYTVMQQMMEDVTGKPFSEYMGKTVLEPLGMTNSTYEQPLPLMMRPRAATGYFSADKPVWGGWHVYPEMAAAGLWTTPSDLARFVIAVPEALTRQSNPVLSQPMVREMLIEQKDGDALGVFVEESGEAIRFSHDGRDAGFDTFMIGYCAPVQGAVIMMNANDNSGSGRAIINAIAKQYRWASGLSSIPPAWQRDEFFNALATNPRLKFGAICIVAGLLVIAVSIGRRIARRYRAKR